jgi:glutathione S-transferase
MLTLHHLNASRSIRILWLLEELADVTGLKFDLKSYRRDATTGLAPPELAAVHPLGKAPVLVDGPFAIAESAAITTYLMAHHDHAHALHPRPQDPSFPAYLEWVQAAEGAVFLPGLMVFYLKRAGLGEHPLSAYMAAERSKALAHAEAHIAPRQWFAGDAFTAADCMMGFMIETLAQSSDSAAFPGLTAWRQRAMARPAWARAMAHA